MAHYLLHFSQDNWHKWLEAPWTIRFFPTKKISKSCSWKHFTTGVSWIPSHARLKTRFCNISNRYGWITTTELLIISQQPGFGNSKNSLKTGLLPYVFFVHVNIFNALRRLSVILQFFPSPMNCLQTLWRLLFNMYGTSLTKPTLGQWVEEKACPLDIYWLQERNNTTPDFLCSRSHCSSSPPFWKPLRLRKHNAIVILKSMPIVLLMRTKLVVV